MDHPRHNVVFAADWNMESLSRPLTAPHPQRTQNSWRDVYPVPAFPERHVDLWDGLQEQPSLANGLSAGVRHAQKVQPSPRKTWERANKHDWCTTGRSGGSPETSWKSRERDKCTDAASGGLLLCNPGGSGIPTVGQDMLLVEASAECHGQQHHVARSAVLQDGVSMVERSVSDVASYETCEVPPESLDVASYTSCWGPQQQMTAACGRQPTSNRGQGSCLDSMDAAHRQGSEPTSSIPDPPETLVSHWQEANAGGSHTCEGSGYWALSRQVTRGVDKQTDNTRSKSSQGNLLLRRLKERETEHTGSRSSQGLTGACAGGIAMCQTVAENTRGKPQDEIDRELWKSEAAMTSVQAMKEMAGCLYRTTRRCQSMDVEEPHLFDCHWLLASSGVGREGQRTHQCIDLIKPVESGRSRFDSSDMRQMIEHISREGGLSSEVLRGYQTETEGTSARTRPIVAAANPKVKGTKGWHRHEEAFGVSHDVGQIVLCGTQVAKAARCQSWDWVLERARRRRRRAKRGCQGAENEERISACGGDRNQVQLIGTQYSQIQRRQDGNPCSTGIPSFTAANAAENGFLQRHPLHAAVYQGHPQVPTPSLLGCLGGGSELALHPRCGASASLARVPLQALLPAGSEERVARQHCMHPGVIDRETTRPPSGLEMATVYPPRTASLGSSTSEESMRQRLSSWADLRLALVALAEAVCTGNQTEALRLFSILRAVVSPVGTPAERIGHYTLEALERRIKGCSVEEYVRRKPLRTAEVLWPLPSFPLSMHVLKLFFVHFNV